MPIWICATCGNHYPDQESPPRVTQQHNQHTRQWSLPIRLHSYGLRNARC